MICSDYELIINSSDDWFCKNCLIKLFPFNNIEEDTEFNSCILNQNLVGKLNLEMLKLADHLNIINASNATDDEDIDPDKNFLEASYNSVNYLMPNDFNELVTKHVICNENFSILHLNARSLKNKIDNVRPSK